LLELLGEGKEPKVTVNNYIVSNAIMKGTGEQVIITYFGHNNLIFSFSILSSTVCKSF
jgi:hypothetical protein